MRKTAMFLGMLAIGFANAQYDGKVGINNETPKATLEIKAYQTTGKTKEGLLIPRLEKSVAKAMITQFPKTGNNKIEESTLIYVKDNVVTGDNAQFVGTGKGFYYFDATDYKWTKLGTGGSGATAKTFTARLGQSTGANYDWTDGGKGYVDFYEFTVDNGAIMLPNPTLAENKGRIIHFKNSTGGTINYTGTPGVSAPDSTSAITASSAQIIWSNGAKWYLIGGRN